MQLQHYRATVDTFAKGLYVLHFAENTEAIAALLLITATIRGSCLRSVRRLTPTSHDKKCTDHLTNVAVNP